MKSNFSTTIKWVEGPTRSVQIILALLIVAGLIAVHFLVIYTGGTKTSVVQSMYVPIVLSAIVFGIRGGLLTALVGGYLLGPIVPLDVVTGEMQLTRNWVYRAAYFVLISVIVGYASDGIRAYIRHLRWISNHDIESKLPNYVAFEQKLAQLKRAAAQKNSSKKFSLLVITLANIEEIFTHFGQPVLHEMILQISERIKRSAPANTVVYRLRSDQLCLLLRDAKNPDTVALISSLYKAFQDPFFSNGLQLHGDITLGVAQFQSISKPASYYIQKAVSSVSYGDTIEDTSINELSPESEWSSLMNIELLGYLKEALATKQLAMHYQPKIQISDGAIVHAEALMRWNHPRLGNIAPGNFIPRAERSTLIDQITEYALDQALSDIVNWRRMGLQINVSVNVTAQNLMNPRFVYQVMSLLEKHGVEGASLELELTESTVMQNISHAMNVLTRLSKLGVKISIDDFGTGYSSLQCLHSLPISLIKIDQSFILSLDKEDESKYIVDATVNLAHKLELQVIAEGVETRKALEFLKGVGCEFAQGYLISKALPATEFLSWRSALGGHFRTS